MRQELARTFVIQLLFLGSMDKHYAIRRIAIPGFLGEKERNTFTSGNDYEITLDLYSDNPCLNWVHNHTSPIRRILPVRSGTDSFLLLRPG